MDLDNEELMETKKEKGLLKEDTSERVVELAKLRKELNNLADKIEKQNKFVSSKKYKGLNNQEKFYIISYINGMNNSYHFLEKRIEFIKKELFGDDKK